MTNSAVPTDHLQAVDISMKILRAAVDSVDIGVSGIEIDEIVGNLCSEYGVEPAFYNQKQFNTPPFPANLCISVNEEVVHGVPDQYQFKSGDLVKLDFGVKYKGFYTDHCVTVGLGEVDEEDQRLVRIGKMAVESAVEKCRVGNYTGDLGYSMQSVAEMAGFNVVKSYVGHAIGKKLHVSPEIPAYGNPGTGTSLEAGMILCIEAQVVAGSDEVYIDSADNWTVVTEDNSNCVMFEYMVEVTKSEPNILTDTRNWEIFK